MHHHCRPTLVRFEWFLGLLLVLFCAACDRQAVSPPAAFAPDEVRHFSGTWSTAGNRQTMDLGQGRQATIFSFTGSLLLSNPQRLNRGFKAEVLGLSDTMSGLLARCIWTDERGDKVFSELRGKGKLKDNAILGRFIGGTGRYAGVTGEYAFTWQRLIDTEEGQVSGRVTDLEGWARLDSPSASPSQSGGPQ
jgi:hypothetical protein